jgi:bile acid:Na+ symporter, BASS family
VVQVTLLAKGDVPLSIVMTVWSTLAAVILTPLLTKVLAGAYIPVDAVRLSLSTLQVKDLKPIVRNETSLSY